MTRAAITPTLDPASRAPDAAQPSDWETTRGPEEPRMKQPRIDATEFALTRIEQVRANRRQPDAGVRIAITGRRDGAFTYDMQLIAAGEERAGDIVAEGPEGVPVHVPLTAAAYLDGITLDADPSSGGLTVDNPNPPRL